MEVNFGVFIGLKFRLLAINSCLAWLSWVGFIWNIYSTWGQVVYLSLGWVHQVVDHARTNVDAGCYKMGAGGKGLSHLLFYQGEPSEEAERGGEGSFHLCLIRQKLSFFFLDRNTFVINMHSEYVLSSNIYEAPNKCQILSWDVKRGTAHASEECGSQGRQMCRPWYTEKSHVLQ